MFDFMEDCIHLKACRRVQAIGRKHRLICPRYCTDECTAYKSEKSIRKEVEESIIWAFEQGQEGNNYININLDNFIEDLKGEQND